MSLKTICYAAAVAAGLTAVPMLSVAAVAQTAQPPAAEAPATQAPATQTPAPGQISFSEEKLKSFVVALLEVNEINKSYLPRVQAAKTAEEKQQLGQEAQQKMVEAVEGTEGITVDEYTSIVQAAQSDPKVAEQINGLIQETAKAAQ